MSHAPNNPTLPSVEATPEEQAKPARCALASGSGMATLQRITTGLGKPLIKYYEVPVRVLAVAEGYAMVRRPRCAPFVLEAKRVRNLPATPVGGHNGHAGNAPAQSSPNI